MFLCQSKCRPKVALKRKFMRTIKQTCRIEKGLIIILAVFCAVKIKETYYECCCLKWHDTQKLNMNFPYRFKRRFYWILCESEYNFFSKKHYHRSRDFIHINDTILTLLGMKKSKKSTKSPCTKFVKCVTTIFYLYRPIKQNLDVIPLDAFFWFITLKQCYFPSQK